MLKRKIWYILGILFLSVALSITGYYFYEEYSAGKNIVNLTAQVKAAMGIQSGVDEDSNTTLTSDMTDKTGGTDTSDTTDGTGGADETDASSSSATSSASRTSSLSGIPLYVLYPDMDMPTVKIGDWRYIGLLEIPSIGLSLPVMEDWSYEQLEISPCRYSGSVYTHDIVICGHNYRSHFSPIKWLEEGTEATFTDVDGNVFTYVLSYTETISPGDTDSMVTTDGSWDMTLFTCNTGGGSRKALRFTLISE